ncbi:hypothetical protein APS56_07290 [Pseudalgibacter alginicilyticus]|uniref:DUF3857 domain-containing protein n=1 Tax=Pseudalgibacter alginicilyticus TaxID=1736674 RepID=A0A0P0D871_9FLAO|nr:DUF3857 domain-containing protein [Pseudalgibacter alginicilyticus]ALJ04938.1 hypothetical protein APS56_07290 [Pseudalgibacter alginicilyticus]
MVIKYTINCLLLFMALVVSSQENIYTSFTIPDNLTQNANAVIRSHDIIVSLKSSKDMSVEIKRVITVLNKMGDRNIDAYLYYNSNVKINNLNVLVFDNLGNQIKKIKKNDFKDVSAVDGGTLYSDYRLKYLEYTPIMYPYTIEFISEIETDNTAFIDSFRPLDGYYVSVENSTYTLNYSEEISIRKKEKNFEKVQLHKEEIPGKIYYKVAELPAIKREDHSPSFRNMAPQVFFASEEFNYEGVMAKADDWSSMGKWFNNYLLNGRSTVSETTKQHILELVKGVENPVEKAKIVYRFVQDNTRYISVQVGIGGMQPISAEEVDKVKYGDCKGLTNYTKALLEVVGVKSNYTRLFASSSERINVDKEFVSFSGQTNHVILNIPMQNQDDIWLECTSQKLPFGFIGDFTDDRDVMVITPEGGEIKRTKKYQTEENIQLIKGYYSVSTNGEIFVNAKVSSKGIQYGDKYELESETPRNLDVHYKKRWKYINNIRIENIEIDNDKTNIQFNETINFNASNYSKLIGDRMLITVNALNRNTYIPDRYRERALPLKIYRGFKDIDEVEIELPTGFKVESLPKPKHLENKFGDYHAEIIVKDENTIIYKRQFLVNDGDYPKEDYEAFRDFYKEVAKLDNSKIALIKI